MLEAVGIFVAIIVASTVLKMIWRMLFSGAQKAFGIAPSSGPMGAFEIQARFHKADPDGLNLDHLEVEARGLMPTTYPVNIAFVTSIIDVTDEDAKPVLCMIEALQEPETIAFQQVAEGGRLQPDSGFSDWVRIGAIPMGALIGPTSGPRKLAIAVRVIDSDFTPNIRLGIGDPNDPAVIADDLLQYPHTFDSGYEEAAASMVEGSALAVKMAIAVSFADGTLDDSEGETISAWITRLLTGVPEGRRDELRDACNTALIDASREAKAGNLSLSTLTDTMNALDDVSYKFQAIELCLDVMVADDAADESELDLIRRLATAMDIDYDELMRLKDQRTVGLTGNLSSQASMESLLDIDPDWPKSQIQKHLRSEFRKWNGRMNSLTDANERQNAQQRLNLIAEARKKYE